MTSPPQPQRQRSESYSRHRPLSPVFIKNNQQSPSDMATATHASVSSIPIPSHSSSCTSSTCSPSFSSQYHSPARSLPSSSSLTAFRSHPYTRPSISNPSPTERESNMHRIHLPPPNSSAPLNIIMQHPEASSATNCAAPLSSLAPHSPPARQLRRTDSNRGIQFPPLHTLSGASPPGKHSPSSMGPPAVSGQSTSPGSSGRTSPTGPAYPPPLRPSYAAAYEHYHHVRRSPPWRDEPESPYTPHSHREPMAARDHSEYADPISPPLRALPSDFRPPPSQPHHSYYPATAHPHYTGGHHEGRSRSHSSASLRGGARDDEPSQGITGGVGHNRRLAHLMSEQKRRESINSGFAALRTALPSSIPTDSKAIILRKAVSHIAYLETLLQKAGIPIANGTAPVHTPSSWGEVEGEADGDDPEGDERDVNMDDDSGKDEDEAGRGQTGRMGGSRIKVKNETVDKDRS